MKKLLLLLICLTGLILKGHAQSLIINEVSQGPSGSQEYVEFLVIPDPSQTISCTETLPCLDLRGWIFDDNNGYFTGGPAAGVGIAAGACRFANDPFWSCIPVGTIIIVYNDGDLNAALPGDDLSMADANCGLTIPISSTLFERVTTTPNTSDMTYPVAGWVSGGSWAPISMANGDDSFQVYDPSNTTVPVHGVSWGNNNQNNIIYFAGAATDDVFYADNSVDCDFSNQNNWLTGCAGDPGCGVDNQTPGTFNSVTNQSCIEQLNNSCTDPMIVSTVSNDETCSCDGDATASATGSSGSYTYEWYDDTYSPIGQSTATASGLCAGTYNVIVISSIGCEDTATVVIAPASTLTIDNITPTDPSCAGACDGSITVSVSGGTPPYSYQWYDAGLNPIGTDSPTLSNQCAGDYSVEVTDASGGIVVLFLEEFSNGCTSDCFASSYVGPNGAWTITNTGANGGDANDWYVSGAECGNDAGVCGTSCGATDPSLHISSPVVGDAGAVYMAGGLGFWFVETDKRAESPVIDLSGQTGMTISFNYIENGDGAIDNAELWYNDGSGWTLWQDLPKTTLCGGQGLWTNVTMAMPAWADNNPNVQIGFRWYNNDDNVGTDPSFAVDDIEISIVGGACPAVAFATLTDPTPPVLTITDPAAVCAPGTVDLTDPAVTAGSDAGTLTYWTDAGATSPLAAPTAVATTGTYYIQLDVSGCTVIQPVNVVVNPQPTVSASNSGPVCADVPSFTVSETGGQATSWSWVSDGSATITNPTDQTPTITGAVNGETFTVSGTDANGCQNTAQTTITINPLPTVTATNSGPICADVTSFTVSETGGQATSWLWVSDGSATITSPADQTPTITNAINGETFTVTGTDANGCQNTAQTTITINPLPTVTATNSGPICADVTSFTVSETGGEATSWSWVSDGSATITNATDQTPTITGAVDGEIFTVTATDINGCQNTAQTMITINPLPAFTISGFNDPSACGLSDGDITLSGLNPFAAYTLTYDDDGLPVGPSPIATDGSGNYVISGLNAGTYSNITISDGFCSYTDGPVTLTDPAAPSFTLVFTNPTTCLGTDGTITLQGLAASTTYDLTYTFNAAPVGPATITTDGSGNYIITGLSAGTYSNFIVDLSGCIGSDPGPIVLTDPPLPVISAMNSGPVCTGQSFTVSETGGEATSWSWVSDGTAIITNPSDQTPTITGAVNGETFTVTGTAANGCQNTAQTTITINPLPTVTAMNSGPICADVTSFIVSETGGEATSWSWVSDGAATITNSTDQTPIITGAVNGETFTVTGTDANGCQNTAQTTITINPLPTVTAMNSGPICADVTSFTVGETGGQVTSWSWVSDGAATITNATDQTPTITGAVNGETFTVTGTDANGCQNTAQTTITINPLPTVTATNSGPICADVTSFTVSETGGQATSWSWVSDGAATITNPTDQTPTITGAVNGETFTITGTDANGCQNTAQTTIAINPLPTVTATNSGPICADVTSFTVSETGGQSTSWLWVSDGTATITNSTDQSPTITGAVNGETFTVTGTDANGCQNIAQTIITINAVPSYTLTPTDPLTCNATDGSILIDGLNSLTDYELTYFDGTTTVGPQTITSDGAGQININSLGAGTYDVTLSITATGCTGPVLQTTLNNPGAPVIDPIAPYTSCGVDYVLPVITGTNLSGTQTYYDAPGGPGGGGASYAEGSTISNTITLYAYDENGSCWDEEILVITINPVPNISVTNNGPVCDGSPLTVSETGGDAVSWQWVSDGSATITNNTDQSPSVSGAVDGETFTVTILDVNGCQNTGQTTVNIIPLPTVSAVTGGGNYCQGDIVGDIMVDVTGTASWTIDYTLDGNPLTVNGSSSPISLGNTPGTYVVTGVSDANCSNSAGGSQTITVTPTPVAPLAGIDTTYCSSEDYVPMTASGGGGTLTWYDDAALTNSIGTGTTQFPHDFTGTTVYYVTETVNGCEGPESMVSITIQNCDIIIPTAITPDNDGNNDTWEIVDLDMVYPDNVVRIYNRWGNLLFEHDASKSGPYDQNRWDGTYNGDALPVGSYFYIIEFNDKNNGSSNGAVSIILN